jgi:hypothetical protein
MLEIKSFDVAIVNPTPIVLLSESRSSPALPPARL